MHSIAKTPQPSATRAKRADSFHDLARRIHAVKTNGFGSQKSKNCGICKHCHPVIGAPDLDQKNAGKGSAMR